MISDALDGKIDLILTKSISRFARNTVDTLTAVRTLKEKGVEVFFEKENIYTLDSKGELFITIMSSLAQEESRSISENTTWGQRKRFADGKVTMPYSSFLGYEKGKNGVPKIVESEAVTVRLIYRLFLEGKTPTGIAQHLTQAGIPTPAGKQNWRGNSVQSILQNEKYKGDAILQKRFTVDFLTKKNKINEGEVPKYYVENSHPGIVSDEVFALVQQEFERRDALQHTSGKNCFSSRIVCGECGCAYGSKLWHSTDKYRRTVWQCNAKFHNEKKCSTPHLYEANIKAMFIEAFNSFFTCRNEILSAYSVIVKELMDNTALEKEAADLRAERDVVLELMRQCVRENSSAGLDQREYRDKYDAMIYRHETAQTRFGEIDSLIKARKTKLKNIEMFMQTLKARDGLLTEFNEGVFIAVVESITVFPGKEVLIKFKDGTELPWAIK